MSVVIRAHREGHQARVLLGGALTLVNAMAVERALADAEPTLRGCSRVELDLTDVAGVDGSGAVLLARLLDRLEAEGCRTAFVEPDSTEGSRQVALYRARRTARPAAQPRSPGVMARFGASAAQVPTTVVAGPGLHRPVRRGRATRVLVARIQRLAVATSPGPGHWRGRPACRGCREPARGGDCRLHRRRTARPLRRGRLCARTRRRRALQGTRPSRDRHRHRRTFWCRPCVGDRHHEGVRGDRRPSSDGLRSRAMAGRATLHRAGAHRAAARLGWRRPGPDPEPWARRSCSRT